MLCADVVACHKRPTEGQACRDLGALFCTDGDHAIVCRDFRWRVEPCRGPAACVRAGDADRCDQDLALPGDVCRSDGLEACEKGEPMRLRCVGRRFERVSSCRGPGGCNGTAGVIACDDTLARAGDPCDKDGAPWVPCTTDAKDVPGAACSRDGAQVLLCRKKTFHPVAVCRGPGGCAMTEGRISCDVGVPQEGDACSIPPGGGWSSWRCSADGKSLLVCSSLGFGHYVLAGRCRGHCSGPPDEAHCDATYGEVGDSCPANLTACSRDRTQILECRNGRMAIERMCRSCSTEGRFGSSSSCK